MAKYSFDIQGPEDFFKKLQEDYHDFQSDPLSSRYAINCAMTAWHLWEWVWNGRLQADPSLLQKKDPSNPIFKDEDDFKRYVVTACPNLEVMRNITNGYKHFGRGTGKVKSTELHKGAFSRGFDRGHDISLLQITFDDGSKADFDTLIQNVMTFWETFFTSYL